MTTPEKKTRLVVELNVWSYLGLGSSPVASGTTFLGEDEEPGAIGQRQFRQYLGSV